ncbi:MAG: hypothetical protein Q8N69_02240 [bacterium]|nr:hypothetical protein [bacterium]
MNNDILKKTVPLSNVIFIIIILFLLIGDIFFFYKYSSLQTQAGENEKTAQSQKVNNKVVEFSKLFIEKVLKAEGEVDFETRLKLENAVCDLKDEEILAKWQSFIGSETEEEAQQEVKNLLELQISKIN